MTRFTLQPSSTRNPIIYDHHSTSSDTSKQLVNSIITNHVSSDKMINSTSKNVNQFLFFFFLKFYSFILLIENFKLSTTVNANTN
jgi:hypothetical protein